MSLFDAYVHHFEPPDPWVFWSNIDGPPEWADMNYWGPRKYRWHRNRRVVNVRRSAKNGGRRLEAARRRRARYWHEKALDYAWTNPFPTGHGKAYLLPVHPDTARKIDAGPDWIYERRTITKEQAKAFLTHDAPQKG